MFNYQDHVWKCWIGMWGDLGWFYEFTSRTGIVFFTVGSEGILFKCA